MKPYKLLNKILHAENIYANEEQRARAKAELDKKLGRKNRRISKQTQLSLPFHFVQKKSNEGEWGKGKFCSDGCDWPKCTKGDCVG